MKSEDLFILIEKEILPQCFDIMKTKGQSYSGKEDKLGNFKRLSVLTNSSPEKVLFIYLMKHIDAISSFIREEYTDSEAIKGRIMDVINYMFLLSGLLAEEGKLDVKSNK